MSTAQERRHSIMQHLAAKGRSQVTDLAHRFGVSTVTMRGDLNELEQIGWVIRLHGSAVLSHHAAAEVAFAERRQKNLSVKARIGGAAADLINNGDTIILDAGTTTHEIARHLVEHESLLVMTNGLNIAVTLTPSPGVELLMLGGHVRKTASSCSGRDAELSLARHRFDTLFLGVDALDLERGLTSDIEEEASLNRQMIAIADRVIAVTDSSKANRRSVYHIGEPSVLNGLVTDSEWPADSAEALRRDHGVKVTFV